MLHPDPVARIYIVDTRHIWNLSARGVCHMITTIQRWGNSLAVRIPKPFAAQTELSENSTVDISVDGGRIVVTPTVKDWKLSELVGGITAANTHKETVWGDRAGAEAW